MTAVSTTRRGTRLVHGLDAQAGARRLLVISYHFAPSRDAGALRWQKLAGFAVERGWAVDVVTLDPASLAAPDWGTLDELPAGVQVYGVPERRLPLDHLMHHTIALRHRLRRPSPGGTASPPSSNPVAVRAESLRQEEMRGLLHSARDAMRAFHAWRDYARGGAWARRAARLARHLLARGRYDAVITCGPPHMTHAAGRTVAAHAGLPFVMDMRDLWSLVPRLPESVASPLWYALARRGERRAVRAATMIVTNTEPSQAALSALYPEAAERIITILNGYDEGPLPPSSHSRCFVMAYTGSIYLDRDPSVLFRAVARVVREYSLSPADLRLEFMGASASYGGTALEAMAEQEGIPDFVRVHPSRPRAEAMQLLARAAMLVSLPQDTTTAIPSKIFEYVRFDAWLLALAERDSATELVLRDSGADVVAPDDLDAITAVLRSRYLAYAQGVRPTRPRISERFSRRAQAQRLFDELERHLPARHASTGSPR